MVKRFPLGRAAALMVCLALSGVVPATAAGTSPAIAPTSMTIDLPTSDRAFPDGPGVETVTANCLACHSAGMILNQPRLGKAAWDAEVHKMIGVYKAPVAPGDVTTIVTYLATIKGAK